MNFSISIIKQFFIYVFIGFSTLSIGTALALPCEVELRNLSKKDQIRDLIQKDKQGFILKYRRMKGYAQLAQKIDIEMEYLFKETSKHLTPQEKRQLEWQQFHGTVQKLNKLKSKIKDKDGKIKQKFTGMDGQARFAQKHFDGDMLITFMNVSAVLSPHEFRKLGWRSFQGTVLEYNRLRSLITDENGNISSDFFKNYVGMDGQARFTQKHFDGNMRQAFRNVSAVSSKTEFKKFGWRSSQGTVQEYQDLKSLITDEDGNIKQEYKRMEGYAKFAEEHFDGNMTQAFLNVSAVLSPREMTQLEWRSFQGTVSEYNRLNSLIKDEKGNIKQEYKGMDGLARFAEEHFNGKMLRAFQSVSAVLGGVLIMRELELGWKVFYGTTDQYSALIKLFEETTFEELQNPEGQQMVADRIFKDRMRATYRNVSSLKERLLNKKEDFKNLNWKR